ncbi:MAG: hypothetical protein K2F99_06405, partial [Muribaculaceae bacterium]|nr:hypothetical protein [Muribaculaceae bacterium]
LRKSQYVNDIDIFISLDDILHILHRPQVEKEFELCGINATAQATSNIINIVAHYKHWAAKSHIKAHVFIYYSSKRAGYRNGLYITGYRHHYAEIMDPANPSFRLMNDAIMHAIPFVHQILRYVQDVHVIDSGFVEPSLVPAVMKSGPANYTWTMVVSRDPYDIQYAYRDQCVLVSPKGDNTSIINRSNMWQSIAERERIFDAKHTLAMYHHEVYPLALAVVGNKLRGIPRLRRVGWKTAFTYLDEITKNDSMSSVVINQRMLDLLHKKGVPEKGIESNFNVSSITSQLTALTEIDRSLMFNQVQQYTEHASLAELNDRYFSQFPLNLPFLTDSTNTTGNPFSWR